MKKERETSFLTKLILVFRRVKDFFRELKLFRRLSLKQKRLSYYSGQNDSEESKLSYFFGMAKTVSIIALVLLLTVTVLFGSGVISYDKIFYMCKDIGYIKTFSEGSPEKLSYSKPVQNQVFGEFKNGLMVMGDSEIKFFTSTGRVTMTEGSEFVNPRYSASNGSVLIYDQGRNLFSVYNSFVKLYSERTDYSIACADMAKSGDFLVVTKSKMYNSVVKIYDSNFNHIGEYSKNSLVVSASMSDDGKYAAVLSLNAKDGNSTVTLNILNCKKTKTDSEVFFEGSMPYMCSFLSSDRIAVFFDDKVSVINRAGKTVHEYVYSSEAERIDVRGNEFAILFSDNGADGKKTLQVFDSEGKAKFTENIEGSIKDIKLGDGYIYVLKSKEIQRISTVLGTTASSACGADDLKIITFPDGKAAVCSQTSASYISFD